MGYYNPAPNPDMFYHHGILGMHWGVRRYQPYPSGSKPAGGKEIGEAAKLKANRKTDKAGYKEARKEYREVRRQLSVSTKRAVAAGEADSEAYRKVANAETALEEATTKVVMPWNRDKKQREIDAALETLERLSNSRIKTLSKVKSEQEIYNDLYYRLEKMSNEIVSKYGKTRLTKLKPIDIEAGEAYTIHAFKTGLNATNFPFLGQIVSGKYNSEWDRQLAKARLAAHVEARMNRDYFDPKDPTEYRKKG